MEFLLEPNVTGGGILISSKDWFRTISEETATALDIVIDVDGDTELAFDFPDQKWDQVWSRFAEYITQFCNSGAAFFCVLKGVTYRIKLSFDEVIPREAIYCSNLDSKGDIYAVEAGNFLVDFYSNHKYSFQEIITVPGFYEVYYLVQRSDDVPLLKFFFKLINSSSKRKVDELVVIE